MGKKTSYRRLNLKRRDPMAQELADDKYRQRVIPKRRKGDNNEEWDDDS